MPMSYQTYCLAYFHTTFPRLKLLETLCLFYNKNKFAYFTKKNIPCLIHKNNFPRISYAPDFLAYFIKTARVHVWFGFLARKVILRGVLVSPKKKRTCGFEAKPIPVSCMHLFSLLLNSNLSNVGGTHLNDNHARRKILELSGIIIPM